MSSYPYFRDKIASGKIKGIICIGRCADKHHKLNGQEVLQLSINKDGVIDTICLHSKNRAHQFQEIEMFKKDSNG